MTLYHRPSSPRVPQDSPSLPDLISNLVLIFVSDNTRYYCFSTWKLIQKNATDLFLKRYERSTSSTVPRSSRTGNAFRGGSGIAASTLQNRWDIFFILFINFFSYTICLVSSWSWDSFKCTCSVEKVLILFLNWRIELFFNCNP